MKLFTRFPLLAKVLSWLVLHLVILGLAFFIFVRWQLGLGLDSLLSGSAGDRLGAFGDAAAARITELPAQRWNEEIKPLADAKTVSAAVLIPPEAGAFPLPLPANVKEKAQSAMPPQRDDPRHPPRAPGPPPRPGAHGPDGPPRFDDDEPFPPPPRDGNRHRRLDENPAASLTKSRPAFLIRGDHGDGYWAGVLLHLPKTGNRPPSPVMLLIRADGLDGSGMFFDFKPWLWGGIAVLLLSVAFWTPFVWGITRYVRRLTLAADQIASGSFQVSLPHRGNDELGNLGRAIESMAARLDHLVTGQKRFLGDAAHELCAPLARIRTGLGILEMKLAGQESAALSSIETDTAELAGLVNEILAFSRAGNRSTTRNQIVLEPLVRDVLSREAANLDVDVSVPSSITVFADSKLLERALGNLIRNAATHAGPGAKVTIRAVETAEAVSITVADNGPGVPVAELPRIFEPFYRLDRSRSRDTGGSGLGLAIVRTSVETCGGEVSASLPESGGFAVTLRFPVLVPENL
jgi:two-component system sensor histidine kinase CpxA